MSAVPGRLIGSRYRLQSTLGVGSTSTVYRAIDEELGRLVAVKVFFERSPDPDFKARQADELRCWARLSHPGLVTLYAGHVNDNPPGLPNTRDVEPSYLVLELIDGPTLAQHLQRGALTDAGTIRLGCRLADSLAVIHAAGVVHRDLKPGNILLTGMGEPKLTDFGVLRLNSGASRTRADMAVGTPAYLGPEQVAGEPITSACDIYSLGLVLLEARKGHREYDGPVIEAALARLNREPVLPQGINPGLAALLSRMLSRRPADRPSAVEVAATLTGLANTSNPEQERTSGGRPGDASVTGLALTSVATRRAAVTAAVLLSCGALLTSAANLPTGVAAAAVRARPITAPGLGTSTTDGGTAPPPARPTAPVAALALLTPQSGTAASTPPPPTIPVAATTPTPVPVGPPTPVSTVAIAQPKPANTASTRTHHPVSRHPQAAKAPRKSPRRKARK